MDKVELKTKLCTEGVINESLEERELSEKGFTPIDKLFVI